jgi:hypothetical protein
MKLAGNRDGELYPGLFIRPFALSLSKGSARTDLTPMDNLGLSHIVGRAMQRAQQRNALSV